VRFYVAGNAGEISVRRDRGCWGRSFKAEPTRNLDMLVERPRAARVELTIDSRTRMTVERLPYRIAFVHIIEMHGTLEFEGRQMHRTLEFEDFIR
jgi:hypothetical protein